MVYINGQYLDDENALLNVTDMSLQRSYAVFDFFRTINGLPLFLNDHLDRFYASAAEMFLPVAIKREALKQVIHTMILQDGRPEIGIRITLTGGLSPDGYQPATPNLIIQSKPVVVASEANYAKSIRVLSRQHQRELPHIKTINYLMAVWLQPWLLAMGADDVLYCNNGLVTETPRSNVFMVTTDNKLITPNQNMLRGVTRKNVLQMAAQIMPVEERDISLEELSGAAEIFISSTTKRIMPVVALDGKLIGNGKPGQVTDQLYNLFRQLETESLNQVIQ